MNGNGTQYDLKTKHGFFHRFIYDDSNRIESGCGDEAPRNQLQEDEGKKNISNFPAACNAIYSLNQYFAFCCMFVSFLSQSLSFPTKNTLTEEKNSYTKAVNNE